MNTELGILSYKAKSAALGNSKSHLPKLGRSASCLLSWHLGLIWAWISRELEYLAFLFLLLRWPEAADTSSSMLLHRGSGSMGRDGWVPGSGEPTLRLVWAHSDSRLKSLFWVCDSSATSHHVSGRAVVTCSAQANTSGLPCQPGWGWRLWVLGRADTTAELLCCGGKRAESPQDCGQGHGVMG